MAPKKTTNTSEIPESVPLFLKKTYHMIDTCDPLVASWSEDGETFVIKDPTKFEKVIIPQFFKHSKFTSFVRQLNFYSFRKIKYVDTIRLDPKLEAETANFWRFRHEKFQRGKPHLLTEIKRMTASQTRAAAEKAAAVEASKQSSDVSSSEMKEEIDTLKKRLEEMNRSMNQLTSMVQKVSLNDTHTPVVGIKTEDDVLVGNKRKKVEFAIVPEVATSSAVELPAASLDLLLEDNQLFPTTSMEMDAMSNALDMPMPKAEPTTRESSTASNMTDVDFVDQLFDAFGDDTLVNNNSNNNTIGQDELMLPEPAVIQSSPTSSTTNIGNHPDPELMNRLSEALAVLPKEMQEQIVNRLIASITSNAVLGITSNATANVVPKKDDDDEQAQVDTVFAQTPEVGMPLAAATLASLLSYYSSLVKDKEVRAAKPAIKSIPVIPCHA